MGSACGALCMLLVLQQDALHAMPMQPSPYVDVPAYQHTDAEDGLGWWCQVRSFMTAVDYGSSTPFLQWQVRIVSTTVLSCPRARPQ